MRIAEGWRIWDTRSSCATRDSKVYTAPALGANLNKERSVNYWLSPDIGFPRLGGARESPARGPRYPWPNYVLVAFYFTSRSRE
jgi:hypothetical protein